MSSGLCFRIQRFIRRFRRDNSPTYSHTGTNMVPPIAERTDRDCSEFSLPLSDDSGVTTSFDYIYPAMSLDEIKEAVLASFSNKGQKRSSPHFDIIVTIPGNEDVNMEEMSYISAEHHVLSDVVDIVDSIASESCGDNNVELKNVVGDGPTIESSSKGCKKTKPLSDLCDPSSELLYLNDEVSSYDRFEDLTDSSFENHYSILNDIEEQSVIDATVDSTTSYLLDLKFAPIAIDGPSEVTYDISNRSKGLEDNDESFKTIYVTLAGEKFRDEVNNDIDNKSEHSSSYEIISSPITNAVIDGVVSSNQSDTGYRENEEEVENRSKVKINRGSTNFNGATFESLYAAIACSNFQLESKDGPAVIVSDDPIDSCIEIDYSIIEAVDVIDDGVIVETNDMQLKTTKNCSPVTDSIHSDENMEDKRINSDNEQLKEKDESYNTTKDGTESMKINGCKLDSNPRLNFQDMMDICEASIELRNHDDDSSESCLILRGDSPCDSTRSSIIRISFDGQHIVYLVMPEMPEMDQEFLMAAKSGELDTVKECINNGVDINVTSPGGLNALHFASRENHFDVANYVIDKGIDANAITKRLNSALHIACLGGNTSIASLLLKHGCPLNVQAMDDITPLYMAAQENHIDTVKLLLDYGADPHIPAKGGYEPVDIAIQQGYVALQEGQQGYGKVVQMLLQHKGGLRALHVAARRDDPKALELLLAEKLDINERAPNGYTPLHVAAKNGSLNAANYLIDHGADLNSPAKGGVVPLHVASRHGQINVVGALIEAGAKLGIATDDGLTALHCAARNGHHNCVELLVVRGAPLTAKTKHGLTALHMAAQANHTASANHIITHGAHIDDVTLDGVTSLHVTSHYGHVETCQLLIEKGADIDQKARNGYTALHIAAKKNREAVVQLLLKYKSTVNIKNNNGQIPLHVAAFFGHVNIVLLLLQAGASLEATTIREETVLHIACRTNQIQIVRLLLRNGANVNAKSKDEDTPLHNACRQGSSSLVNLLLDNRGDPNITNKEGCCALHLAARDGQDKIIDALLDHNADVSLLSKRGFTPLHEAVKKGHMQIIEMLLERKADVNAIGKNGLTPLHFACHYDRPEVAVKLLNSGADPHVTAKNGFSPLHISAEKNQVNIVSLLLDRSVEVDLLTGSGVSPLHLAAKEGNVEVVDMLLEHGASPCTQSMSGLTPLHVAVHYNQIEVVQKLLKYGASMEIQTKSGFTPLHLACMHGHIDVAEQLLSDGSDVEAKTKNGNTPLHIASYKGHQDIVDLLLKYNAPPNALNKDGYSALYIAEVTGQTAVVTILTKVTKVVVKIKSGKEENPNRSDKVRSGFLAPESLEEIFLVDTLDEAEEEAHIQKKVIKEDFEESFAGLEDSRSDHGRSLPSIINESIAGSVIESDIEVANEQVVMADNSEDFLKQLEESDSGITHDITDGELTQQSQMTMSGYIDDVGSLIDGDITQPVLDSTSYNIESCSGPHKQGRFLVSFNVDARGCVMESKHTGIRVVVPRGACKMPTRITARLRKTNDVMNLPQLSVNEALVSRVVQLSPVGTQFLKPVIFEIPHFAALKGKQRELVALTCSGQESWREHGTYMVDDEQDTTGDKVSCMKIITQEVPEKIVVISRPRKERFVVSPEGATLQSASLPNVKVIFPPETLNTSTKVVLQVQLNDDSLLHPEEQTHVSPIICLEPPTTLSKSITVIVPCDWLLNVDKSARRNIRLLAWMTRSPRKSAIDRVEFEWKDITGNTGLSIVDDTVTFETSEFTRYWVVQTNSPETLTKRINQLQQTISATPFSVRFFIYGRLKSERHAELRIFVVTDEHAKEEFLESIQGFKELSRSSYHHLHSGQTVHLNISGNLAPVGSQNSKLIFRPFQINRLKIGTEVISPEVAMSCRVTFIGSLRKDGGDKISSMCTLSVSLTSDMMATEKLTYPEETVNDEIINVVGTELTESWLNFAKELNMNKRDKQAVADISTGKRDVASIRLLEYWRSKNPSAATYKALFDALKRFGLDELAENVYNTAPNKFSRDVTALDLKDRNFSSTSSEVAKSPLTEEASFAQGLTNGHSEAVFEEITSSPVEEVQSTPDNHVEGTSAPSASTPDGQRPCSPTPCEEPQVLTDEERETTPYNENLETDHMDDSFPHEDEDALLTPDDLISRSIDDLSSLSPSVSSISPDPHDEVRSPILDEKSSRPFSPEATNDLKESPRPDEVPIEENVVESTPVEDGGLRSEVEEVKGVTDEYSVESTPAVEEITTVVEEVTAESSPEGLDVVVAGDEEISCDEVVEDVSQVLAEVPVESTPQEIEEISSEDVKGTINPPIIVESLSDDVKTTDSDEESKPAAEKESEPVIEKYTVNFGSISDNVEEVEDCQQIVKDPEFDLNFLEDAQTENHVTEEVSECTQSVQDPVVDLETLETLSDSEDQVTQEESSGPSAYELSLLKAKQQEEEEKGETPSSVEVNSQPKELVCENPITDTKIEETRCGVDVASLETTEIVDEPEVTPDHIDDKIDAVVTDVPDHDADVEVSVHHSHRIISTEETVTKTVVKTVAVVSEHDHVENSEKCCTESSAIMTQETQVVATKKVVSIEESNDVVTRVISEDNEVPDSSFSPVSLQIEAGAVESTENDGVESEI